MKVFLAAVLATFIVTPAFAQFSGLNIFSETEEEQADKPAEDTPPPAAGVQQSGPATLNSPYCAFSFFSDSADVIDFSGSTGDSCFDTGKGNDTFNLNPRDFPDGALVYSDSGRSTFRFSNGPTTFFDANSTAREVRAGSGDDTLRFGTSFIQEDGRASMMPETRVYPGGGNDLIVIGSGQRDPLGPRNVSNLLIFPQQGGLGIEAGCGRPRDTDSIDFIVENAPSTARIAANTNGCGVAMRNHAAPTTLEQDGGRTSLVLRPVEQGSPVSVFEAEIINGSALSAIMIDPSSRVFLNWQGHGTATVQVEALSENTGGNIEINNDGFVFAGINAQGGAPSMTLVSNEIVEVSLSGSNAGNVAMVLGAPEMRLDWTMSGLFAPRLTTPEEVKVKAFFDAENPDHVAYREAIEGPAEEPVEGEAVAETEAGEEAPAEAEAVVEVPGNLPPEPAVAPAMAFGEERDEFGRTKAGRESVLGGHPVGTTPTVVMPEPAFMVEETIPAGLVDIALRSVQGGCEIIRIFEGDTQRAEAECGAAQILSAAGASRIEFEADGRSTSWDVEGLRLGNITLQQ